MTCDIHLLRHCDTSDALFISKVGTAQQSEHDRYLEIYNPTSNPIVLSEYALMAAGNSLIQPRFGSSVV